MDKRINAYFAEQDNAPPPGVQRMTVRNRAIHTFGPYRTKLESSCGLAERRDGSSWRRVITYTRVEGSARIFLYDARGEEPDEPVAIKRFAVDDWAEAVGEMRRLEKMLAPTIGYTGRNA